MDADPARAALRTSCSSLARPCDALADERGPRVYDAVVLDDRFRVLAPATIAGLVRSEWLPHGGRDPGALALRILSSAAVELRGRARLLTLWGDWEHAEAGPRDVVVPPGGETIVRFRVSSQPPARSWALARITAFGGVHYSETIALG